MSSQWIAACAADSIGTEEVVRFDHGGRTFAIVRADDDGVYCTDGLCSHEAVHLADGLVMGHTIECPKHSGEFDVRTGEALRAPACKNLRTYATRVDASQVFIEI